MKVTILGSGTAIPIKDRGSPCVAVFIDDAPVLFDMGPGTLRQLVRLGISCEKIGHVFLTHFHPDHTADLIHFLFATRSPAVLKKRSPFTVSGPTGLYEFIHALQQAYPQWLNIPDEIMRIEELKTKGNNELNYDRFMIKTASSNHTLDSLAYRIKNNQGKCVVISGDTGFCDDIIHLAKGADLLILEAAFPEGHGVEGHLTPSLAGRMACLAGVKHLVLTHFYPECLKTDIAAQCRSTYQGELTLGEDLLQLFI